MAAEQQDERPADGPDPAHCTGAREYALRRLESADTPVSPSGLAEEYGCGASHMRTVLSELYQQGEADKAGRGQYVEPEDATHGIPLFDADGSDESLPNEEQEESMPTQEEYEEQHSGEADASPVEDADSDVGSGGGSEDEPEESHGGTGDAAMAAGAAALGGGASVLDGGGLSKGQKQVLLFLAVVVVLWLVYRTLYGGVQTDTEVSELEDDGGDQGDEGDGLVGGLAG